MILMSGKKTYSMFPYHIYESDVTVETPHYKHEPGRDIRYNFIAGKEGQPNRNIPGSWGWGVYPNGYGVGVQPSGFTKDQIFFGVPDPAGFSPYEKSGDNVWRPKK